MRRRKTHLLAFAIFSVALLAAVRWYLPGSTATAPASPRHRVDRFEGPKLTPVHADVPPPLPSPFENTHPDVAYLGSQACAGCHETAHRSYLETAHSLALDEVDAATEPVDANFSHPLSGRRYESLRQEGQLWHRELLADGQGEELLLAAHKLRFRIGSGHHSRSYLVDLNGFLVESPITWYTSKQAWQMSPGYDAPVHPGFERPADLGCLQCHAGRVEPDGSRYRVRIHEESIGCENCHGPGALHVEKHRSPLSSNQADSTVDLTIVNPARLSRTQSEAICAQCHLRSAATVLVRGRSLSDFRPGLRLEDFRIDYSEERDDKAMTVVGHIEQMRMSRCYQASESMTCTTCHDPHGKADEASPTYFREKCNACHDACGLPEGERKKQDALDNCITCHMPKTSTDIPHFAFTHHRISVPAATDRDAPSLDVATGRLIPTSDLSHLPPEEQDRCLALAYLEASEGKTDAKSLRYRSQSLHLLEARVRQAVDDPEVQAALARLYWEQDRLTEAIPLAQNAVLAPLHEGGIANSLFVLGDSYLRMNQPALARDALERLTHLRRNSEDWIVLAYCESALGNLPAAVRACHQSLEIQPGRSEAHLMLAEFHGVLGDLPPVSHHRQIARRLDQASQPKP